jgi:VanZ family protein
MTVKINHVGQPSGITQLCYYWLPPLFLSSGILIMAGDLGSIGTLTLPVTILKYLLPSWSASELYLLYGWLRKVGHFMAYAALFGTYVRAWRWHMRLSRPKAIFLALAICLVVSSSDEWRQSFHESRTGCPHDVALDMSGAFTAAIVLFPFLRLTDQGEEG